MSIIPAEIKGLIDSNPPFSLLVELAAHYRSRQLPASGVDSVGVFESPRAQIFLRTAVKGTAIGAHFHATAEEIVIVVGGAGELLINGEWRPVERGHVHVCPRGIIHDTRALQQDLQFVSIFTPHLPPGGDLNLI